MNKNFRKSLSLSGLILLLIFPVVFRSQIDSLKEIYVLKSLYDLLWIKDNQRVKDSCDKYLSLKNLSPNFRSRLLGYKANAISFMIDEERRKSPNAIANYKKEFDEIDELFKEAATTYPLRKTEYYCAAYEFFKDKENDDYGFYLDSIIKYGYKPEMKAIGITADFYAGKRQWIGSEIGLFYYDQFCRVGQKIKGKKIEPDNYYPYSCNVLHVGLRKSLNDNAWCLNFSPLSGSYLWVNIRPFNLCYYFTPAGNTLCYSPEAGIHVWFFYFNYCKSFSLNEDLNGIEGDLFNIKLQIPVKKFKN